MPFTFTEILINNNLPAVLIPYKLIDIFGTRLFLKLKPFKTGTGDGTVNILHRFSGVDSFTVQFCNLFAKSLRFCIQFVVFSLDIIHGCNHRICVASEGICEYLSPLNDCRPCHIGTFFLLSRNISENSISGFNIFVDLA